LPQEYLDRVNCGNCGGSVPLCARPDRGFIIGFTAHGSAKNQASDPKVSGGCYGNGGNVRLWWQRLADKKSEGSESEKLSLFLAEISKKYAGAARSPSHRRRPGKGLILKTLQGPHIMGCFAR
jgi:hypothetical protein